MSIIKNEIPILEFDIDRMAVINPTHEKLDLKLPICREIGLDRVLITCIDGNIGSEKTILANGGVFESTVYEPN